MSDLAARSAAAQPSAHAVPARASAGKTVALIGAVILGLSLGGCIGLIVGLATGLIPFTC
jgi:predicted lipid-binding transport protein (Tim44 family)